MPHIGEGIPIAEVVGGCPWLNPFASYYASHTVANSLHHHLSLYLFRIPYGIQQQNIVAANIETILPLDDFVKSRLNSGSSSDRCQP